MSIYTFEKERLFKTVDENDKEITLKVVRPNNKEISDADLKYKTKFAQALRDGVMTRAQAEKLIRDHNILSDDIIESRDQIAAKMSRLRADLGFIKDRDKGLEIVKQINELREELENINSLTLDIMNQTAEAYAEDFRLQWLTSVLIVDENNEKYFEDYEDFVDSIESSATLDCIKALILFVNNLKDNFELEFDENKWLLEQDVIKEDGTINLESFVDKKDDAEKDVKEPKTKKKAIKKKAAKKKAVKNKVVQKK